MTPKVYTTTEVCDILKITRATIAKLANEGKLVRVLRGRYTIASVEALLEGEQAIQRQPAPLIAVRQSKKGGGRKAAKPASSQKVTPLPTGTRVGQKIKLIYEAPDR